ncbi:matrixin family metalloprotease [Flavobacterium sp.]|jgi:archaemetzincin|uniref:matrixin family metalloprotease n=1 Tax=Flavobacterium sp. TaxID=239 RepID=UPI002A8284FD|nr:matrixin family metalloprotease [Flavobacterium sp.]
MKIYYYIICLGICFSCQKKVSRDTKVAIQPYTGFSKVKTDSLAKLVEDFYNVSVEVLEVKQINKSAFINTKSPRYRADSIIKFQRRDLEKYDFILGLTNKDISTTKRDKNGAVKEPKYKYQDWGIMGLAYCPGNSCIISSFRLKHKDEAKYFNRLKKVTVHEFGHNLGLPHCPDKKCVMTDAVESIKTIDNAELNLCSKCKSKLN